MSMKMMFVVFFYVSINALAPGNSKKVVTKMLGPSLRLIIKKSGKVVLFDQYAFQTFFINHIKNCLSGYALEDGDRFYLLEF